MFEPAGHHDAVDLDVDGRRTRRRDRGRLVPQAPRRRRCARAQGRRGGARADRDDRAARAPLALIRPIVVSKPAVTNSTALATSSRSVSVSPWSSARSSMENTSSPGSARRSATTAPEVVGEPAHLPEEPARGIGAGGVEQRHDLPVPLRLVDAEQEAHHLHRQRERQLRDDVASAASHETARPARRPGAPRRGGAARSRGA